MGNIITSESKGFFFENLTPEIAQIYKRYPEVEYKGFDNNFVILYFGKKTRDDVTTAQLKISGDLNITGTDTSCGCTEPVLERINDTEQILTIIFDQYKITNNVSKFVTLIINGKKNLRINVIMNH